MPTISVIIPVYNVEPFLRRCLDSLLDQTYTDWEAICVNDGSPDNSQAILEEYAKKDSRFIVIEKENGGVSSARNTGMESATGEYITFLDPDDFIHPQTFEFALTISQRHDADLFSWYKDPLFRAKSILRRVIGLNDKNYRPVEYRCKHDISKCNYHLTDDMIAHLTEWDVARIPYQIRHFYVWRLLIRSELAKKIRFISSAVFEDFAWISELALHNPKTVITSLPFHYYQLNSLSLLSTHNDDSKILNWIKSLQYLLHLYKEKATDHQYDMWKFNCMWPVLHTHIVKKLKSSPNKNAVAKQALQEMRLNGVFDNPPSARFDQVRVDLLEILDH